MPNSRKALEMVLSWGRVFLAASLAVLLTDLQSGVQVNWTTVTTTGLVSVIPVILRWLDPMDTTYGIGS